MQVRFIHSLRNVLQLIHSLFKMTFYTECDLVLPLSRSNTFTFQGHPVDAYFFFLVSHPFYISLNKTFWKAVPTQDVANVFSLASCYHIYDVPFQKGLFVILPRFSHSRSN
jgi:hypothetical protein